MARVVILGAGGVFGGLLARLLADQPDLVLILAGRSAEKLLPLQDELKAKCPVEVASVDIHRGSFPSDLAKLDPTLVIHCAGPFQGQSYRVAEACLECGSHYIDLADDADFVCNITQLSKAAIERGLLFVSGASSVPGLSSAVVDHFRQEFKCLDSIDCAIAPGNRLDRGQSTIAAILSSTGQPYPSWSEANWKTIYGWMETEWRDFGGVVGKRRVANVPIPDLNLFPKRYYPVRSVGFKAGLELGVLHNAMSGMAWLAKRKLIKNWRPYASLCLRISRWFLRFGSDAGAMQINLQGLDYSYQPKRISWTLIAENGVGPNVPALPAAILAKKILAGECSQTGAMPCMGLFSLDEFTELAKTLGIVCRTRREALPVNNCLPRKPSGLQSYRGSSISKV